MSKDAVEEMLTPDEETADALAEFDFVMGEDSGSETDVTVIEMEDNGDVDIHMPEESTTQGFYKNVYQNLLILACITDLQSYLTLASRVCKAGQRSLF